ncbi:antibiotic biosynthesis monooxygenase family protein [Myxococcus faecalis]|uniref:putative quinol monooxygenase n=1 Tax=Myxococcus faecalis TaxID=3115646 RepID=UPI003CE7B8C3
MPVKARHILLALLAVTVGGIAIAATPPPPNVTGKKEQSMIVEYIRYDIPAERADAFIDAYRAAGEHLRASPHCLRYEVGRGSEEPHHLVVRIEWDSIEGHLQGFRTSPAFQKFFVLVRPFVSNIQEMKHYRVEGQWSRS